MIFLIRNALKKILMVKYIFTLSKVNLSYSVNINRHSTFEGVNKLYPRTTFINSHLGYGSYIGQDSIILNTKIGKFCSIGPRVMAVIGHHPLSPFVSTSPCFFSTLKQNGDSYVNVSQYNEYKYIDEAKKIAIEIGHDTWIGSDVKILEGIKIGIGVVIGAGSIVTKDIPNYEIWGGNPAKKIKDRFNEEEKKILVESSWWSREISWIKSHSSLFLDIESFKKHIEGEDKIEK